MAVKSALIMLAIINTVLIVQEHSLKHLESKGILMNEGGKAVLFENQEFVPVGQWQNMLRLVGQEIIAFNTKYSLEMGCMMTDESSMYVGKVSWADTGRSVLFIKNAVKYNFRDGSWQQDSGYYNVGISPQNFDVRRVHCPSFFRSEKIID